MSINPQCGHNSCTVGNSDVLIALKRKEEAIVSNLIRRRQLQRMAR